MAIFPHSNLETQAHELDIVANISTAIASILELDQLLETVSDLTKEKFGLYHAHIYLLDDAGEYLVLSGGAGEAGRLMKARGHRIALDREHSLVARSAREREGVIVNDVQHEPDFLPNALLPDTHAEMAIPLIAGDTLFGVLDVQANYVDRFTAMDVQIKTTLGNQIAVAIQNARAFEKIRKQQAEIQEAAKQIHDIRYALDESAIVAITDQTGTIQYVNDRFCAISKYAREELIGQDHRIINSGYHSKEFIRNLWRTIANGKTWRGELCNRAKDGSIYWVDTTIVPLANNEGKPRQYIAIRYEITDRKRIEEETYKRAQEMDMVAAISTSIASIFDLDQLLETISNLTKEKFGLYHAHIYLLDEAGEYLVLSGGAGEAGRTMKARGHRISINHEHSLVARCARDHEGVIANDVQQAPDFLPNALLPNTRAEMAIPMVVADRLVGVLDVQADYVGRFTPIDVQIKTTLGNQIAVAVQNAHAFRTIHKQQAALQETTKQVADFRYALDESAIVAITDQTGKIVYANDRFCTISKYSREELIGQDHRIINSSHHPKEFIRDLWHTIANGQVWHGELRNRAKDGTHYWVDTTIVPLLNDEGKPRQYIAIRYEITDRKRIEDETRKRAQEMGMVAAISTTIATIFDLDKLLQAVADVTKESFGLYHAHVYLLDDAGEYLVLSGGAGEAGRAMKERGHKIALNHEHSLVARCAREREGVIVNDVRQAPDFLPNALLPDTRAEMAIPLIISDKVIGVLDVQADYVGRFTPIDVQIKTTLGNQIAVAVQNVRSYQTQVEMVDQLRTVDRVKSEFLASMSHELRTPLNSIIGFSRMMLDGADGEISEEVEEDITTIHHSGQHLLSLINDILDIAKIEAGFMELDQGAVDFLDVAEEVQHMTSILFKDKPVAFHLDIEPDLPTLYADHVRVRQILNNLVSNAIKFTDQGEICISAGINDEQSILVVVKDTGMGIPLSQQESIFERFHQADNSSSRKAGGTGLGLTITRHLVELHGGAINVRSEVGKGSEFYFTLPILGA